eukprot:scaffold4120_cov400-Prasinococcus_capsulatus_cf.AAC.16
MRSTVWLVYNNNSTQILAGCSLPCTVTAAVASPGSTPWALAHSLERILCLPPLLSHREHLPASRILPGS